MTTILAFLSVKIYSMCDCVIVWMITKVQRLPGSPTLLTSIIIIVCFFFFGMDKVYMTCEHIFGRKWKLFWLSSCMIIIRFFFRPLHLAKKRKINDRKNNRNVNKLGATKEHIRNIVMMMNQASGIFSCFFSLHFMMNNYNYYFKKNVNS